MFQKKIKNEKAQCNKIIFLISSFLFGQKEITNDDIFYSNKFSQDYIYGLKSMKDGSHYTTLNMSDTVSIEKFSYNDFKKIETILKSSEIKDLEFSGYSFDNSENLILLETQTEKIYRYSKKSIYYVYDLVSKDLRKVFDKKISLASFSPNSKYISYVYRNNIYLLNIETNKSKKITHKGLINKTICGGTDWVYEEEFGLVKGYEWSSNSNYIAYYIFDESKVNEFSMDILEVNSILPRKSLNIQKLVKEIPMSK